MGRDAPVGTSGDTSRWEKIEHRLKVLDAILKSLGVLITVGLFVLGQRYTEQQKQIERATTLLKSLASTNPVEVQMAIEIARHLDQNHQLPPELVPALTTLREQQSPGSSNPAAASLDTLVQSIAANASAPEGTQQVALRSLQPAQARVYVHVRGEEGRGRGEAAMNALAQLGVAVPPLQVLEFGPDRNELRYFAAADAEGAKQMAVRLGDAGLGKVEAVNAEALLARIRRTVPRRQFELWLAPQSPAGGARDFTVPGDRPRSLVP